jgi:hypothetical protein
VGRVYDAAGVRFGCFMSTSCRVPHMEGVEEKLLRERSRLFLRHSQISPPTGGEPPGDAGNCVLALGQDIGRPRVCARYTTTGHNP